LPALSSTETTLPQERVPLKNCLARIIVRAVMTMSKKSKTPAASKLTSKRTEAPMVVSRANRDAELTHADIARVAYERFLARGGVHGFHVEDWLAAEAELRRAHYR
jgi:hypothetical protein